ncbi:MAG TPA: class I SAM-dependent methyltransferase [Ignavibacteria bacterium]|nr:class I SAM-dependent methyltransferase [Ignavibacteria bacterium]
MNQVLEEILKTGFTQKLDGSPHKVIGQISEEEGLLIQECAKECRANTSVEIGLAFGTSALFICESLRKNKNTKHTIIDPYQNFDHSYGGIGLNNLKRAGFENIVRFIEKPSHLGLAQLESEKVMVDLAFVDGWHTFDHVIVDFFMVDKILHEGGIVIMDDSDWPAIEKVCSFISSNRSYEFIRGTSPRTTSNGKEKNVNNKRITEKFKNVINKTKTQKKQYGAMAFRKISHDKRSWDHFIDFL